MKSLRALLLAPVFATFLAAVALAADANGTWKWTSTTPNGQEISLSLRLKEKDGAVSGAVVSPRGETPISDATLKDGDLTFSVVRERDGEKHVTKYHGKVDGDSIKGTIEMPGRDGGAPRTRDWNAQRAAS